ncbi:MAG: tyrosine-type recombinase/integrase [Anaerolineae bacterium]|nr:tyrosine-type recombinase/integrase [Anaerolineae bacterium]
MSTDIITTEEDDSLLIPANYEVARNPAHVYIVSLSERSRRVQLHSLKSIVATVTGAPIAEIDDSAVYNFQWDKLRYQHTTAIRSKLADTYSHSSTNRMLSALRRVLKECWRLGYIDNETMARACDIENVTGETVPAGRDVKSGEINALVDACYHDKNQALGVRDMAILATLYTTGMRRNELAGLELADYTADDNKLLIRKGKRNKERFVYLPDNVNEALHEWLQYRGKDTGALFLPIRKGGKIVRKIKAEKLKGITAQTVYDMLAKRATQANVAEFSPHDLRRTFVGDMLDNGVDIATVQKIAGHASVSTTARYDRRGERAKAEAVTKIHFPYRKRPSLMDIPQ